MVRPGRARLGIRLAAILFFAILACLLGSATRASAASVPEKKAFKSALDYLSATFYQRAEADFGDFISKFPESDLVPEAILHQAQARYFQTNYAGAAELLTARLSDAGTNADQYLFLRGEAEFKLGRLTAAADTFVRLQRDYPASPRRLEAAIEQAAVHSAVSDWKKVIDLLLQPNGVFQAAISTNAPASAMDPDQYRLIVQGYLMLAESQLAREQYTEATATLKRLGDSLLEPVSAWKWQSLLCRIQLAQGRLADALDGCGNLVTRAAATGQPALVADSISFKARLLEKMERPDEATTTYAENLKDTSPPERQREALLHITSLCIDQKRIPEAVQKLEQFLAQFPKAAAGDLGWFTLGELRLRLWMDSTTASAEESTTNTTASTNLLRMAREAFNRVLSDSPASPLRGRAELNLGWCGWLANDLPAGADAFQGAIEHLPVSAEQATARFKLGDVRFRQGEFKAALSNYLAVSELYDQVPEVVTNLVEPALYQAVRSGLRAANIPAAYAALTKILAKYPDSFHSDDPANPLLLFGRKIGQEGHPEDARRLYTQVLAQTPDSPLRAEIELGIARTWEEDEKWPEAVQQYESWLAVFTNHPARPRAEYFYAQALSRAGDATNAIASLTNFVARFPTNTLAPLAQWRIGIYYYNQGDPKEAEKQFQLLNKGPGDLPFQARMMAGRCAMARQSDDAGKYFSRLYTDTNCPIDLRLEAIFAYGDFLVDKSSTNLAEKISDFRDAINSYNIITDSYPTNRLAPLAWGQKAICYMQWAHKLNQPDALTNVMADFQKVIESPQADLRARSLATIGLGVVLEQMAASKNGNEKHELQERALEYYVKVCFESPIPGEQRPDPFCADRAGWEAIRLAEDLLEWQKLVRVCDRLEVLLPNLRDSLEKKKQKAQENLARASL